MHNKFIIDFQHSSKQLTDDSIYSLLSLNHQAQMDGATIKVSEKIELLAFIHKSPLPINNFFNRVHLKEKIYGHYEYKQLILRIIDLEMKGRVALILIFENVIRQIIKCPFPIFPPYSINFNHINQNDIQFILMNNQQPEDYFRYVGFFKKGDQYHQGVYQLSRQGNQNVPIFITLATNCQIQHGEIALIDIFFPKKDQSFNQPLKFQQDKGKFDVVKTKKEPPRKIGIGLTFLRFSLDIDQAKMKDFEHPPQLIPFFQLKTIVKPCKRFAIKIKSNNQQVITALTVQEQIKKEDSQAGVYFVKLNQQPRLVFQGFYDFNDQQEHDFESDERPIVNYFLYKEILDQIVQLQSNHECSNEWAKKKKLTKDEATYPRNSVCKLKYYEGEKVMGEGTASILVDQKGQCNYLITCAHNFYGIIQNPQAQWNQKGKYSIYERDKNKDNFKIFRFEGEEKLTEINARINQIHIPPKYKKCIEQKKDYQKQPKRIRHQVKAIGNFYLYEYAYYDIAIIELQQALKEKQGFRINPHKQLNYIKPPFELSGYPMKEPQVDTQQDCMYYDSTQHYKDNKNKIFVSLSKELGGNRLILHNLFAIKGNSGSPIYGQVSGNNCHLIGIHIQGKQFNKTQKQTLNRWEQPFGQVNVAIYLNKSNKIIQQWLMSQEKFKQFIDSQ